MGCAALVLREAARRPYGVEQAGGVEASAIGASAIGASAEAHDDAPVSDPFAFGPPRVADPSAVDDDTLEDVGDEIATLAAHLHSGMQRYLALVAWFDRMEGWKPGGHRTCAHWLAVRTGHDIVTAREHVRVARALEELPQTGAAMARGALSFSKVRALSRVATAESETDLLELAEECTAGVLERMARAWKKLSRKDEAALERELYDSRRWDMYPDGVGMAELRARMPLDRAHLVMRAVDAWSDELYRQERPLPVPERERAREASRRRADAAVLIAERSLAALAEGDAPISGSSADRYQVMLHVEPETLAAEGEPGMSELEDGSRVSAEASRRIACDAALVRVTKSPRGEVLDVGRKTRTIPPALRRALEVRDRGCRFPGCGCRYTDAHHVVHWADGGETSLSNTILLCRFHHRLVHEEGWKVEWWGKDRQAAFIDPRGNAHLARFRGSGPGVHDARPDRRAAGSRPAGVRLVDALIRGNRLRGPEPDAWTAGARWEREREIPDGVYFRALASQ